MNFYCNIYCHPDQDHFLTVESVFDNGRNDGLGVANFTVSLSESYANELYESCKETKETHFEASEMIPTIKTPVIKTRFCNKYGVDCSPEVWLNAQGQETIGWPWFGVLNVVQLDDSKQEYWDDLVIDCSTETESYPSKEITSCNCVNCPKLCVVPPLLNLTKYKFPPGKCVLQNTCGKNLALPDGKGQVRPNVPCFRPDSANPLIIRSNDSNTNLHYRLIKSVCPSLIKQTGYDEYEAQVCCSRSQIADLESEVAQMKQLFGRCHACYENLLKVYCATSCNPDQSSWMQGIEGFATLDENGRESIGISIIKNYWNEENMNEFFDSCKDVTFPQTNGKVVEDLLCDGKTGGDCDARTWLNFQGSTSNGFAPYDMIFETLHLNKDDQWIDHKNESVPDFVDPISISSFPCDKDFNRSDFPPYDYRQGLSQSLCQIFDR